MTTKLRSDIVLPSPEELQALIARAHRERNEAIRNLFRGLLSPAKTPSAGMERAGQKAAVCS